MLDPDKALDVAEACVRASQEFWGLDDSIKITVMIGPTENLKASGECTTDLKYRRAYIILNPLHITTWEQLWQVTAHEVTHIVVGELDHFHSIVKTEKGDRLTYDYLRERVCVSLERVFLREKPYPGDESFEAEVK